MSGEWVWMNEADRRLWQAWLERSDQHAFCTLIRPHVAFATDFARRLGCAAPDADEAVQQALVRLTRERGGRPVEVGLRSWLGRRISLQVKTMRRALARRQRHEQAHRPAARDDHETLETREEVEAYLRELPAPQREAVVLRYLHDMEYREIAHVMGASENACRLRVHKGIERLRRTFGAQAGALVAGLPLLGGTADAGTLLAAAKSAAWLTGGIVAVKKAAVVVIVIVFIAASSFLLGSSVASRGDAPRAAPNGAARMTARDDLERGARVTPGVPAADPDDAARPPRGPRPPPPPPTPLLKKLLALDKAHVSFSKRGEHERDDIAWSEPDDWVETGKVTGVRLHGAGEIAKVLPLLDELPVLYALDLWASMVDDAGLEAIALRSELISLHLGHTKITDEGMPQLARLFNLRELALHDTRIADAGLASLTGLDQLQELDLRDTRVTGAGLAEVAKLHALESLYIEGSQFKGKGLHHLAGMPALARLDISETRYEGGALEALPALPRLDYLDLNQSEIDAASFRALGRVSTLETLNLSHTNLGDGEAAYLRSLTRLKQLYLMDTHITDAAVDALSRLTALEVLDVRRTDITPQGIERLRAALPNCRVRAP